MTILVDMDDTIEQLVPAWVRGVNAAYGRNVPCAAVTSWDVSAAFPGLTREQVYAVPLRPGFWDTVEPMPGAAETIKRLMAAGHAVYLVTATQFESVPEKLDGYLRRHFPFFTRDRVIVAVNKQMIRGDVLIDDGVHNLEGGDYEKILFTAPHNANYDAAANGMYRANGWDEIEAIIEEIAERRNEK